MAGLQTIALLASSTGHTLLPHPPRVERRRQVCLQVKWWTEKREQEHREVTITHNFRLHCDSPLSSVPGDRRRAGQDSNHSRCQIATSSEIELIAWTNLQSDNAICVSEPWEGFRCPETLRTQSLKVVIAFLQRLVYRLMKLTVQHRTHAVVTSSICSEN